ncbi:MAG: hypothetical protein LC663_01455, partial [Actinobacteria bacterium]|nr:hypothetical protein [Actinomycetota bacterium]
QSAIDADKGKDKVTAQKDVDDMRSDIAAARAAIADVPSRMLALTPQGYPGNRSTIDGARASVVDARKDLANAIAAARAAAAAMKG